MQDTLWIDIETRSRIDLKRAGVYRYVRCPDFKILMGSFILNDEPVKTALSEDEIWDIPGLWDPKVLKVAHNANFERICFSEFSHRRYPELSTSGYLNPEHWEDTMALCSELAYPKSLDKAAQALDCTPKDTAGTHLINLFCKPNRKGEWNGPDTHPEKWLEFMAYCEQDTETLKEVHLALEEQGGWPTAMERQVWLADAAINDRGIAIDVDLARRAVAVGDQTIEEQKEEVRFITGETGFPVENPGSVQQLHEWFEVLGYPMRDLRAETVEKTLKSDIPDEMKEVLQLRQDLALAAPKKFAAALASNVDGRLHGTLRFGGAHTLRWSGQGTQVQNLPRESFKPEGEDLERLKAMANLGFSKAAIEAAEQRIIDRMVDAAILDLTMGLGTSARTLKRLVRPLFIVDGTVVDYKSIEAFVIAWLAGEEWVLQAARDGRDIYVETADRMGGLTRAQGKIAVLAFGFNGGAGSLKAMATDRDTMDIEGETVLMSRAPDDVLYERFVWPWRDANPNTVRLWKILEQRFRTGGPAGPHLAFEKDNGNRDRLLRLPSGRAIAYRKAGQQEKMKWSERRQEWEKRKVLTFSSAARYPSRDETYGGRLAENATQGVARDFTAEALVRLERAGLRTVGHVHDEIIVEGTRDVEEVKGIMMEVPAWAEGFPLDGEGFTTYRYKKG